jgi:hypothetical protein
MSGMPYLWPSLLQRKDPMGESEGARRRRGERKAKGLCQHCGKGELEPGRVTCTPCNDDAQEWIASHRERMNFHSQNARYKARRAVLDHYGQQCACCGESQEEFLVVDHVDGGGTAHRREIPSSRIYFWLKNNGFPPGFQILCHNCNYAKFRYGRCPHEVARSPWRVLK